MAAQRVETGTNGSARRAGTGLGTVRAVASLLAFVFVVADHVVFR